MVLVDAESGTVNVLNDVAALVWQCFDGDASLAELVVDLAEGFEAPAGVVRDDVVAMTKAAGRAGLLEGVAPVRPDLSTSSMGLAQGDPITLPPGPDDGPRQAERSTLLVNWSATCGFCVRILPEFAALQSALDRARTDIVFVDQINPEASRKMLDDHGLIARILFGEVRGPGSVGPFVGMGTPVAYLLDGKDRVASPLAYGAENVVELARSAAGNTPPVDSDVPAADLPRFLPVAGGVCGPASPLIPARRWERTGAYEVGGYRVGIRAGSASAERTLAAVFGRHRLPADVSAPDDYSIVLSEGTSAGRRDLNLLLAGNATLARSRSPRRLMRALAGHLSCLFEPEPGLQRLDAIGALIDGQAVLLPKALSSWPERVQAPLARLGIAVVDEPFAHVDAATRELVVGISRVGVDEAALAELEDPPPGQSEPAVVPLGRFPLTAWLLPASLEGRHGPLSPAAAVAGALGTVVGSPQDVAEAIESFVSLLDGIEAVAVPCERPADLVQALRNWLNQTFNTRKKL
jgi:hypothetical protein